jgi:GGDEF domain-containing protein
MTPSPDSAREVAPADQSHMRRAMWVVAVVIAVAYPLALFAPLPMAARTLLVDLLYLAGPALAASGALFATSLTDGSDRRFWLLFATAMLAFFMGEAYFTWYQLSVAVDGPPGPSASDVLYLVGYGLLFLSIASVVRPLSETTVARVRTAIDVLCVSILAMLITGLVVIEPLTKIRTDVSAAERVLNAAYPALDIALVVGLVAVLLAVPRSRWRTWELLIGVGLGLWFVSDALYDLVFVYRGYSSAPALAYLLDLVTLVGYLLFFMAAGYRMPARVPARIAAVPQGRPRLGARDMAVPIAVAIGVPVLLVGLVLTSDGPVDLAIAVGGSVLLVVLVVVRTVLLLQEGGRLVHSGVMDEETGLLTLRAFTHRLDDEIAHASASGRSVSVVVVGSSNEQAVTGAVDALRAWLRSGEAGCRCGGHLAVVMPEVDPYEAFVRTGDLLAALDSGPERTWSAGIAAYPMHGADAESVHRRAVAAMRWSVEHVAGRAVIFDERVGDRAPSRGAGPVPSVGGAGDPAAPGA